MKKNSLTLPLVLSFGELGWMLSFVMTFAYVSQSEKTREAVVTIGAKEQELRALRETVSWHWRRLIEHAGNVVKSVKENLVLACKNAKKRLLIALLRMEIDRLRNRLSSLDSRSGRELIVRKEIAGLRGNLDRVVIVFDHSKSMENGGRWDKARDTVHTWLEFLPVKQCVLVAFGTTATAFPDDGTFLDVAGVGGDENRRLLLGRIDGIRPGGGTNTLDALRLAYSYGDVDTIILFTDGAPNDGTTNVFDPQVAEAIYALCESNAGRRIPINAVGLGDYFEEDLSEFLLRVAEITQGAFIGR